MAAVHRAILFYAMNESVRMVHTFIFDGDQEKDFIRGLGVRFDVPMREELQNRHVRIAGDQGFLAEPVRLDRRAAKFAAGDVRAANRGTEDSESG